MIGYPFLLSVPSVLVWAVAVGLALGVFFLLLAGVAVYFLWKRRRRVQGRYQELFSCMPPVPACTSPVLLATQSPSVRPGEVPFFLPPCLKGRSRPSLEEEEEGPAGQTSHRGSLVIRASFPLGSLRPDLYRIPEGLGEWASPCGDSARLCFSVQCRREREELVVSVLRAANLPARCRSASALVKLQLLPGDLRRRQAKARRRGRNPQFNDSFVFQVSSACLSQSTLSMSVFSVDRLKKHQLEGRVLFPLRELELRGAEGGVVWRDLETESDQFCSEHGDLQVSLNYSVPLQRLTVVVLRARGLRLLRDSGVCVQVSLQIHTQVVKSKRTAVVRGGTDPTFNDRLYFRLRPPQLDEACLRLELLQTTPGESPGSLGLVLIGPFMYARGRELDHWNDMVSKPQELVKQWHGLGQTP
ncbi:synaptotagmin-15 [Megalops cyprinoides]|uniref:synaptotagmin-15 n=1 Tax=Megalops cyprinoides TaxID=118141 RepID=UPI001864CB96|nr:synaptotagmin-15 [Megalops cyprinoides]